MRDDINRNIINFAPTEMSLDAIPTCKSCYQPLETTLELDITRNPRELCVDCQEAEEALYGWRETA